MSAGKKLLACALFLAAGCATRVVLVRGGDPPPWLDRLPPGKNKLCAVGFSGPTFYQQDCIKNAAENARSHLAESIKVTIRTVTVDISDGTRGSYDRDVYVSGSESASEAVLQGSEIEGQWIDIQGVRGEPNGCYAFVCIDPQKPLDKLVDSLEEKLPPKTVEKVRENAEAAFKELEQQEQLRAPKAAPPPKSEEPQAPPQPAPGGEATPDAASRSFELPANLPGENKEE